MTGIFIILRNIGIKVENITTSYRIFRYFVNFFICLPYLIFTIFLLVLSLNIRGYVPESHRIIYFENLSNLSNEGEIFDKNDNIKGKNQIVKFRFYPNNYPRFNNVCFRFSI